MDAGLTFPPYLNDRLAFKESSLKAVGTVERPNVHKCSYNILIYELGRLAQHVLSYDARWMIPSHILTILLMTTKNRV